MVKGTYKAISLNPYTGRMEVIEIIDNPLISSVEDSIPFGSDELLFNTGVYGQDEEIEQRIDEMALEDD